MQGGYAAYSYNGLILLCLLFDLHTMERTGCTLQYFCFTMIIVSAMSVRVEVAMGSSTEALKSINKATNTKYIQFMRY